MNRKIRNSLYAYINKQCGEDLRRQVETYGTGGESKARSASIAGYYEVPYNKSQQAKPKKVSLVTSKNCPGLTSKYWTYSSKYKRMVLKNKKEF